MDADHPTGHRPTTGGADGSGGHDGAPVAVDPRITLANERTLLAWTRTALAFVAAGLAVIELVGPVDVPGGRILLGLPLIGLGALIGLLSGWRWHHRDVSLRQGRPLVPSRLPWLVTGAVVIAGVVALVVATTRAA